MRSFRILRTSHAEWADPSLWGALLVLHRNGLLTHCDEPGHAASALGSRSCGQLMFLTGFTRTETDFLHPNFPQWLFACDTHLKSTPMVTRSLQMTRVLHHSISANQPQDGCLPGVQRCRLSRSTITQNSSWCSFSVEVMWRRLGDLHCNLVLEHVVVELDEICCMFVALRQKRVSDFSNIELVCICNEMVRFTRQNPSDTLVRTEVSWDLGTMRTSAIYDVENVPRHISTLYEPCNSDLCQQIRAISVRSCLQHTDELASFLS